MELENKIKCILMDFEINKITLQETTDKILALYNVVGRSEQFYCLSDPEFGGIKRCKQQCKGCENSPNNKQ